MLLHIAVGGRFYFLLEIKISAGAPDLKLNQIKTRALIRAMFC